MKNDNQKLIQEVHYATYNNKNTTSKNNNEKNPKKSSLILIYPPIQQTSFNYTKHPTSNLPVGGQNKLPIN